MEHGCPLMACLGKAQGKKPIQNNNATRLELYVERLGAAYSSNVPHILCLINRPKWLSLLHVIQHTTSMSGYCMDITVKAIQGHQSDRLLNANYFIHNRCSTEIPKCWIKKLGLPVRWREGRQGLILGLGWAYGSGPGTWGFQSAPHSASHC